MIYLIGETGASETNCEKYAQALEEYSGYRRCSEDEYNAQLLEIEALDNAEVDQPTYRPPDRLYLQVRDEDGDPPDEVTWSDDQIYDTDVAYVLASKLLHVRAERDTLQALVPLYRAVDRLLFHPLSESYPKGYSNQNHLVALREVFLRMSVDEEAAEDADEA